MNFFHNVFCFVMLGDCLMRHFDEGNPVKTGSVFKTEPVLLISS